MKMHPLFKTKIKLDHNNSIIRQMKITNKVKLIHEMSKFLILIFRLTVQWNFNNLSINLYKLTRTKITILKMMTKMNLKNHPVQSQMTVTNIRQALN